MMTAIPPISKNTLTNLVPPAPLNNRFEVLPKDILASTAKWESFWKVARVVSLVGCTAIALTAGAFITVWNPEIIFYFSIGCAVSVSSLYSIMSYFDEKIASCQQDIDKYERIKTIYDQLVKNKPKDLVKNFCRSGITRSNVSHFSAIDGGFKKLAAGLAYLHYTNQQSIMLSEQMEKHRQIASTQKEPSQRRAYAYRAAALDQASYLSRIHAAYDLALLKNPFYQKKLEDLGSIQEREPQNMLIDRLYANSQDVFYFHNPKKAPLTFQELANSLQSILDSPKGEKSGAIHKISRQLLTA